MRATACARLSTDLAGNPKGNTNQAREHKVSGSEPEAKRSESDSSQQALNVALDAAVVAVAEEQRAELAEGMAPRQVTVELHSPLQSVSIRKSLKGHEDTDKDS